MSEESKLVLQSLARIEKKQDDVLGSVETLEKEVVGIKKDIESNRRLSEEAKKLAVEGYYDQKKDRTNWGTVFAGVSSIVAVVACLVAIGALVLK